MSSDASGFVPGSGAGAMVLETSRECFGKKSNYLCRGIGWKH